MATHTGVVLTGGSSSRMGTDKSLLPVDGTPMAVTMTMTLAAAGCEPVWCQGGDVEALRALGLEVVPDSKPGRGPLAAIADALALVTTADAVICACDLPDLDADTVTGLIRAAAEHPDAPVVVAADASGLHLVGVWRATAAQQVEALVAEGVRAVHIGLERLGALAVPVASQAVRNVNTPGDVPGPG